MCSCMVLSSLLFLYYFLPISLLAYYVTPKKYRNLTLLGISLVFYAWGEPVYIVLMIFSSIVDYTHGILIDRYRLNKNKSKLVVFSSICINIGLLSFFKYGDFFINNINNIFNLNIGLMNLPLPIGISFYTFQTMSYTIDVYREDAPVQRNFISFATYVSLFPQLIAGPIVRYKTVSEQIDKRVENINQFSDGIRRFVIGLGKKVLLANNIGFLWSQIQNHSLNEISVLTAWIGIIAFSFQIYYDFSGYSDMAIGLGKMFGFDFLENFNYPYISKSITEFWRRWHMSLGNWFRDYVYIPLGGNRVNRKRLYINLFIIWFLTGLWHGSNWNFIVWGLYFGIIISVEKAVLLKVLKKIPIFFQHIYAILIVVIGWVLFVFGDFSQGLLYLRIMFGFENNILIDSQSIYYLYTNIILFVIVTIGATTLIKRFKEELVKYCDNRKLTNLKIVAVNGIYLIIIVFSTAYLVDSTFNPFLYFRF